MTIKRKPWCHSLLDLSDWRVFFCFSFFFPPPGLMAHFWLKTVSIYCAFEVTRSHHSIHVPWLMKWHFSGSGKDCLPETERDPLMLAGWLSDLSIKDRQPRLILHFIRAVCILDSRQMHCLHTHSEVWLLQPMTELNFSIVYSFPMKSLRFMEQIKEFVPLSIFYN